MSEETEWCPETCRQGCDTGWYEAMGDGHWQWEGGMSRSLSQSEPCKERQHSKSPWSIWLCCKTSVSPTELYRRRQSARAFVMETWWRLVFEGPVHKTRKRLELEPNLTTRDWTVSLSPSKMACGPVTGWYLLKVTKTNQRLVSTGLNWSFCTHK